MSRATNSVTAKIPHHFLCPITKTTMVDPVICLDGHSYEREAITIWLAAHNTSPATGAVLENNKLIQNIALRESIEEFLNGSLNCTAEEARPQPTATPSLPLPVRTNMQEGDYPIHGVVRSNNQAMLNALLSEESLKQENKDGKKAIELAADLGYWDLVIRIAKKHSLEKTPTYKDLYNYSAVLYKAAVENRTVAFLALLHAGARSDSTNSQGDGVTHFPARNNNFKIWDAILALMKKGKLNHHSLSNKNRDGKTPIELAAELGHWDLVSYIVSRYTLKSDTHRNIKNGYANVLTLATSLNKTDAITSLLKAGASTHVPLARTQVPTPSVSATANVSLFPRRQTTVVAEKTPSLERLKSCYLSQAGFFNAGYIIFNTRSTPQQVVQTLRERAERNPGGASEETLEVFGLGK